MAGWKPNKPSAQGNTLDIEHNQQTVALQGQKHNFSSKHPITFWGVYIKS